MNRTSSLTEREQTLDNVIMQLAHEVAHEVRRPPREVLQRIDLALQGKLGLGLMIAVPNLIRDSWRKTVASRPG